MIEFSSFNCNAGCVLAPMAVHCFITWSPNSYCLANFTASVGALHSVCSFSYLLRVKVTETNVSVIAVEGSGFCTFLIGAGAPEN